ncbi:transcriptional regulator with XRE-family HTH domain [Saccharopolyspora gloriosae]|uniref:Transcriptional regulator with XRE-family HTH domain n=1 Tax=Saccharopolyspora gloriosae TaxID=455344 RepID=A0A840NQ94_9PSEU|nr:helix-turn-helix transcriptional regulator [Saccharopolyspora gloriosae]MBB5072155.1 transcriptional regulator with XRE-family HTH domain [Saccharopolyspora gloriosae]
MNNSWPAVRRVQVGLILRNLRRESGVKPKEIAERLDWYPSKLTKVERGDLTVSAAEVDVLLGMFGVTESEDTTRLRTLAKEARRRDQPARVPDWAATYVALEGAATEVKIYDPEVIPAMLQTESYARALLSNPLDETTDPEPAVAERGSRANRFTDDGPKLWVVLGEAAMHRQVGGRDVLREQLQHLRKMAARPNITLQLLPFAAGEHVALGSSFTLISLSEPPATFAYFEGLTGAEYMDKPVHTEAHEKAFDSLRMVASSDRETARMLERRVKELKQATE